MPADLIQGPYLTFTVDYSGGALNTVFTVERALSADGPWLVIQSDVPLLNELAVFVDNTAPIGVDLWYRFTPDGATAPVTVGPYQLPANGHTWIKDPARPWADLKFDTCPTSGPAAPCTDPDPAYVWGGLSGLGQAEDAGIFEILNSDVPADVWGRRKSISGTMVFFTRTLDATDRVYDLFTAGGPLQLQLPDVYGWHDAFIQPFELTWEYGSRDQRRPLRRYEVRFRVVGRPLGPIQGVDCANWCEVNAAFPTFGDMAATGATWLELVQGSVLCPPGGSELITDTFDRTVAAGWGDTDTGQTWTVAEGPAADVSVTAGAGAHTHPVVNTFHTTTVPWTFDDALMRVDFAMPALPVGGPAYVFAVAQYTDPTHMYLARVQISTAGAMVLSLRKRDGAETGLGTIATGLVYAPGARYTIRFARLGTSLMAKVWLTTGTEPAGWQVTAVDAALTGDAAVGVRTLLDPAVTNVPFVFQFDNLRVES